MSGSGTRERQEIHSRIASIRSHKSHNCASTCEPPRSFQITHKSLTTNSSGLANFYTLRSITANRPARHQHVVKEVIVASFPRALRDAITAISGVKIVSNFIVQQL